MTIHFSLSIILLTVGIIIGVFSGIVLLVTAANKAANKYLAALVFICVGALFHNFLLEATIYGQFPKLYFLPVILSLGIGPLLYLYIQKLIGTSILKSSIVFLHLLPVLIQFLVYLFCFVQTPEAKYIIWKDWYEPLIKPIQIFTVYVSVFSYLYFSYQLFLEYKLKLNQFYSNTDKITMSWLPIFLRVFLIYYALSLIFLTVSALFKIQGDYFPSDLIRCIIIFTIAVFAIRQNSLSTVQHNLESLTIEETQHKPLSLNEQIEEPDQAKFIDKSKEKEVNTFLLQSIIELVEQEQLYLNPELTIADIAGRLNFSTKTISQTINLGLQKSFSTFINQYRVNVFKERLASGKHKHLSILGLAFECGFNSKSSFNRIFKEVTGHVPKESMM
jgi:AraC-like DNA-binding protein